MCRTTVKQRWRGVGERFNQLANAFIRAASYANFSSGARIDSVGRMRLKQLQTGPCRHHGESVCSTICRQNIRLALTLNVRGPSYLGLTSSISWLLIPCLLTSPGHQQPWYWLSRICRSWSYLMKDFNYRCHINVRNDIICKYMLFVCSIT